jgi:hypothetical protein
MNDPGRLQTFLEPSKREVIEARKEREQQDEDGAPPDPGEDDPPEEG